MAIKDTFSYEWILLVLLHFWLPLARSLSCSPQFRFMRYLLAGPKVYAAMGGNLRCKHLPLIRDKGLDMDMFDKAVEMLRGVIVDMGGVPQVRARDPRPTLA